MTSNLYVLAEDGRTPIPEPDFIAWGRWFERRNSEPMLGRVGWDFCNERRITVSTTFLGIDHGFGGGLPVVFETMIFGGPRDLYQMRYCTWEEAERGHLLACELAGINRLLEGPTRNLD